jgi:hypothetical protein
MLTLCAANGLVAADAGGMLRTTPLGREFLVAGAARDARPYYASMAGRPGVDDWLKVLRTDRPANWPGAQGEADWHAAMRTTAFAESFTAAMDCRGRVLAPAVAAAIDQLHHVTMQQLRGERTRNARLGQQRRHRRADDEPIGRRQGDGVRGRR